MTIFDCSIINLSKIDNGSSEAISAFGETSVPFAIKRVFYSYDIPCEEARGAHAHKNCHQFLIAASGSFEVVVDDGVDKRMYLLNQPNYGLHIPPGIWASEQKFSVGSVCLVFASHLFSENDYIRDYQDFLKYVSLK